jgi:hypothetical protein
MYDYISRSITTHGQTRRLPHQGAGHSTVDHGFPSDGVFLLLRVRVLPSRWTISLRRSPSSLSSLWIASWCEWLSPCQWRCIQGFRVEDPSGARKGGPKRPPGWAGPAGLDRPAQAHLGPVRSPLRSCGSSGDYALCPLHLHDFDDVILASKMEVLHAWSSVFYASIPGGVPRSTSVLATIWSDFIKLMNTNKTP